VPPPASTSTSTSTSTDGDLFAQPPAGIDGWDVDNNHDTALLGLDSASDGGLDGLFEDGAGDVLELSDR
jgi:hypothetical protein